MDSKKFFFSVWETKIVKHTEREKEVINGGETVDLKLWVQDLYPVEKEGLSQGTLHLRVYSICTRHGVSYLEIPTKRVACKEKVKRLTLNSLFYVTPETVITTLCPIFINSDIRIEEEISKYLG